VALRFSARRGADVRLYQLPRLDEVAWRFETPGLVSEQLVGYSADADVIFVLTPSRQLAALDLATGRARVADTLVRRAVVGPDGTALLLHTDGSLAAVSGRRAAQLAPADPREVEGLFGIQGGRPVVIVRGDSGRAAVQPTSGARVASRRLPDGPMAVAPWGDAAAVVTDTGLVLVNLLREAPDRRLSLRGAARAVAFSSSGHRVYVATDPPALVVIDRFTLQRLETVPLPAAVGELRADPFGFWLLGRAPDSVVIVPQGAGPARVVAAGWAADLPAAGPDGTILVRRGDDVVALDRETLEPRGRVPDGAADRWLIIQWDPRRPALQVATPAPGAGAERPAQQQLYVQVSSTTNQQWADDLARDLRLAGMQAVVLPPLPPEETFRVVLGPYPTREEAEDAGRKLGMPYWIFTRDAAASDSR
jgi:hypothetical protein